MKTTPNEIQIVMNVLNCNINQWHSHAEWSGREGKKKISNFVKQYFHSNSKAKDKRNSIEIAWSH